MNLSEINDLYNYNCWANEHLLDTAEQLSPGQLTAHVDHSHGSLRGTLVHTLDAEESWRTRLAEGHDTPDIDEAIFPDIPSLRVRWQVEEAAMRAYLATLKDADLNQTIHYTRMGDEIERVLWHCLVHLVNHGTQHRSESAAILTSFGRSPGEIDFMLWVREHMGK